MLVGIIELVREDDSEEHREMFVEELLKAKFMVPVVIIPEPIRHPDGRPMIAGDSKIQFPMIINNEKQKFFMAFTDPVEYKKWTDQNHVLNTFNLKFEDFVNMLFIPDSMGNDGEAQGLVINPYGINMVIPKLLIASIMSAKLPGIKENIDSIRAMMEKQNEDEETAEVSEETTEE